MDPNLLSRPALLSVRGVAGGTEGCEDALSVEGLVVSCDSRANASAVARLRDSREAS